MSPTSKSLFIVLHTVYKSVKEICFLERKKKVWRFFGNCFICILIVWIISMVKAWEIIFLNFVWGKIIRMIEMFHRCVDWKLTWVRYKTEEWISITYPNLYILSFFLSLFYATADPSSVVRRPQALNHVGSEHKEGERKQEGKKDAARKLRLDVILLIRFSARLFHPVIALPRIPTYEVAIFLSGHVPP